LGRENGLWEAEELGRDNSWDRENGLRKGDGLER